MWLCEYQKYQESKGNVSCTLDTDGVLCFSFRWGASSLSLSLLLLSDSDPEELSESVELEDSPPLECVTTLPLVTLDRGDVSELRWGSTGTLFNKMHAFVDNIHQIYLHIDLDQLTKKSWKNAST